MSTDWTGIIVNVVIALVSAVIGWIARSRVESNRRSYEIRQAHLQALKDDVIQPLLNQLEFYYLPIINKDENNVIMKFKSINTKGVPVDKPTFGRAIELSIFSLEDILERWKMPDFTISISEPRPELVADSQLYKDMLLTHECSLMQKWEVFVSKFDEYDKECYDYVRHLANQLSDELGMPVWLSFESQQGINSARLASFIWERQICVNSEQLWERELAGRHELSCGNQIVAIGTEKEIENCRALVERLIAGEAESVRLQKLMVTLNLESEAHSLIEEFNRFALMSRLKKNCVYTRI